MDKVFIVYIMASRKNGTLYVGVSGDPEVRIWQHKNDWFEGFTKRYGVKRLVWYEVHEDAEAAIQREKRLKEWHRAWKIRLIEARNPDWRDLYPEVTGER
jgi:putative endonuclease